MPFEESLKPVFVDHISAVAKRLGRSVARADDFFTPDVVMDNTWAAIYHSHIVIADCTGRNANVFYEIGLAHALGKPVISITQNKDDVPFDLKQRRFIEYTFTPRGMHDLEEKLYKSISAVFREK
jgi:nucleoside 2-deoxyribosyltransferase